MIDISNNFLAQVNFSTRGFYVSVTHDEIWSCLSINLKGSWSINTSAFGRFGLNWQGHSLKEAYQSMLQDEASARELKGGCISSQAFISRILMEIDNPDELAYIVSAYERNSRTIRDSILAALQREGLTLKSKKVPELYLHRSARLISGRSFKGSFLYNDLPVKLSATLYASPFSDQEWGVGIRFDARLEQLQELHTISRNVLEQITVDTGFIVVNPTLGNLLMI